MSFLLLQRPVRGRRFAVPAESGTAESNRVSLAPKASGSASSLVPEARPARTPAGIVLMPSTVELRSIDAAGHGRDR